MINLTSVYKKKMEYTHEVRYYFSGYVTPESLHDVKIGSCGMTYEHLGKAFADLITTNIQNENTKSLTQLEDYWQLPRDPNKSHGTEVTELTNQTKVITQEDINFFYSKLITARSEKEREKIKKQIETLKDALIVYRLYTPPRN